MPSTDLVQLLTAAVPDASISEAAAADMTTLHVDREHLLDVCYALRDDPALQFAFLVDLTAVDYLPAPMRYEVVYHLACLGEAYATGPAAPPRRLRVKVRVPETDPRLPSIVPVYPAAGWAEREVFDLFGLLFEGHPDLRRLLMPEDWDGHPLRKDYAVQIRKDTASWAPLQVTAEEFAEEVRAQRELAAEYARRAGQSHRE
jgi:NADH-quinone oxidoreductase subunit C